MEEGSPLTVAGAAADSAVSFRGRFPPHRVPVLRPVRITGTDDNGKYSRQSPRGNRGAAGI